MLTWGKLKVMESVGRASDASLTNFCSLAKLLGFTWNRAAGRQVGMHVHVHMHTHPVGIH